MASHQLSTVNSHKTIVHDQRSIVSPDFRRHLSALLQGSATHSARNVPEVVHGRPKPTTICFWFVFSSFFVLMWIGVMTLFHTSVVKSAGLQVHSPPSLRNIVRHSEGFRSIPTSIQKYPRPVSCHVPRCPNANSDPLLHTSHCEYRLTTI